MIDAIDDGRPAGQPGTCRPGIGLSLLISGLCLGGLPPSSSQLSGRTEPAGHLRRNRTQTQHAVEIDDEVDRAAAS
jgi:hypothetical protein